MEDLFVVGWIEDEKWTGDLTLVFADREEAIAKAQQLADTEPQMERVVREFNAAGDDVPVAPKVE